MSFPLTLIPLAARIPLHEELVALAYALQSHIELCGEILAVVQQEHQQLKTNQIEDVTQLQEARQGMLEQLTTAQAEIVRHKDSWMALTEAQKHRCPRSASAFSIALISS